MKILVDGTLCNPSIKNCRKNFFDEKEPWLLIGIPSGDPFFETQYLERHSVSSDQHMKKLMSLREGLHVMMQCTCDSTLLIVIGYMNIQQDMHRAREPTLGKFTNESTTYVQGPAGRWNVPKLRSESSEFGSKTLWIRHRQLENQNSLGRGTVCKRIQNEELQGKIQDELLTRFRQLFSAHVPSRDF